MERDMDEEELKNKLSEIEDKLTGFEQPFKNRLYLSCESENSYELNKYLFEQVPLRFVIATGIDSDNYFEILYHYAYDPLSYIITLKAFIRDRENPSIESLASFLPGAEWIEREIHDTLGIEIKNHPNLRRLVLADDWPEGVYPLRKEEPK